jgi:hypothetical protein
MRSFKQCLVDDITAFNRSETGKPTYNIHIHIHIFIGFPVSLRLEAGQKKAAWEERELP